MSRSGYNDDIDTWPLIQWRGAVASAIRGKRGQAFLLEMWRAMQSLPEPKLIARDLENADGEVCAIGSVGRCRGVNMSKIDPEDHEKIAATFGIPHSLACEIMYLNDESGGTPETRYVEMKKWIEINLLLPIEADGVEK
jgi:hypothetical protein